MAENPLHRQPYYIRVCSGIPGARLFCMRAISNRYLRLHFTATHANICIDMCIYTYVHVYTHIEIHQILLLTFHYFIQSVHPIYYAGLLSGHLKRTVASGSPGQTGSTLGGFLGSRFSLDICFDCLRFLGWPTVGSSGPNCAITFSAGVSCACRGVPLKGWVLNH